MITRRAVSRVDAGEHLGLHMLTKPRWGTRPRRDLDDDKQQEVTELGTQESGNEMYSEIGNDQGKTKAFPGAGRADRSVRTHGHTHPKVDSRPSAADREKGQTSSKQLEAAKKEKEPDKKKEEEGEEEEIEIEVGDYEIEVKKEALNLVVDPRLRGNINQIVESIPELDWDDIESVSYGMMMEPGFEPLATWPTEEKEGMLVYRADTTRKQSQGLQYATQHDFPKNAVMVFKNVPGPFHMRNCNFPVDLVCCDDDMRILAIHHMKPGNELTRPPRGTKHCIECHPGFIRKNIGDLIAL